MKLESSNRNWKAQPKLKSDCWYWFRSSLGTFQLKRKLFQLQTFQHKTFHISSKAKNAFVDNDALVNKKHCRRLNIRQGLFHQMNQMNFSRKYMYALIRILSQSKWILSFYIAGTEFVIYEISSTSKIANRNEP